MKRTIFILFLMPQILWAQGTSNAEKSAFAFLENLQKGDTIAINKSIAADMKAQISASTLIEIWGQMTEFFGPLVSNGKAQTSSKDTFQMVIVPLNLEKAKFNLKLAFGQKNGLIEGCFFVPSDPDGSYKEPSYVDHGKFFETKIQIEVNGYKLNGKLAVPNGQGPYPVLVLFSGSGLTHDEDETIFANKPFRDIAWGLASMGIAVARMPKRFHDYPDSINAKLTPETEYLQDAEAWLKVIKSKSYINPNMVYILGHSQGGMMAPEIAKRNNWIKGIILMAGNARPISELIIEQMNYLIPTNGDGYIDSNAVKMKTLYIRQSMNAISPTLNPNTPSDSLPLKYPAGYWMWLKGYNQLKTAKVLKQSIFVIQGERDYQVTMTDFNLWKQELKGNKNLVTKSYPKLNHLFQEGEGASNPNEYADQKNIPEYVLKDLFDFIMKP